MLRLPRFTVLGAAIAAVFGAALASSGAAAATSSGWVAIAFARCPTHDVVVAWYPNGGGSRGTPGTLPTGRLAREKPPDPRRAHATVWSTGGFAQDNWLFYAERPIRSGGNPYPEYSAPDPTPCGGPGPTSADSAAIGHARSAHGATALRCHFPGYWSGGIGNVLDVLNGSHDEIRLRAALTGRHPKITWDTSRCSRIALP